MKLESLTKRSTFAGYIKQLMSETMKLCEEGKEYHSTVQEVVPESLCAAYEHPSKTRAIQEHTSRFSTI